MSVRSWLRGHAVLAAAGLYAVLAIVLFSPALPPGKTLAASDYLYSATPWEDQRPAGTSFVGSNLENTDQTLYFLPFLQYNRANIGDGLPLWNNHIMGGRPYLGNAQSAPFSPLNAISYVVPFWNSLALIAILKVFTAAFGTFLLARALALRFGGALLAGLLFGFSLFLVIWIPWPTSSVWAFLPWVLLLTDRVARRPGLPSVCGLAVVVALQYVSGHPESSFHLMFMALAFLALRLFQLRTDRLEGDGTIGRAALAWVGAVLFGTALAAITILPFAEMLASSSTVSDRGQDASVTTDPKFLSTLFLYDYYGRPTQLPLEGFLITRSFYVGALGLFLAAAALIFKPTLERVAVAGFGFFSVAMVVGLQPIAGGVQRLPGFGVVHNTRMTILFVLCVALLAGWGLDDLTARRLPARSRWVLAVAGLALLLPLLWVVGRGRVGLDELGPGLRVAWGFAHPPLSADGADITRMSSLVLWLTLGVAAVALLLLRMRGRVGATLFVLLALALTAGDMFRAGMGQNPAIPIDTARQPVTGSIEYLQSRRPARFTAAEPADPPPGRPDPLPPDVAMTYGLLDARGFDYPVEARYDRLWRTTVKAERGFTVFTVHSPINARSLRTLNLLGVADIIQDPSDPPLRAAGLRLVYDRPDARIYSNSRALPRAWVVGSQDVAQSKEAALRRLSDQRFDPRRTAVTEKVVDGVSRRPAAGGSPGSARLVSYEPERVKVRARAARGGSMLVLSDTWFPGWKAKVAGRKVPVERADYLLRGVKLPAGTHDVEFTYEPASFRIGWIVSVLSLVGLFAASGWALWRRRRAQAVR